MPNLLAELPLASRVFIDANILIYHFTRTPISAACTAFLERVAEAAVVGVTSTTALTEVQHRLMVLMAIGRYTLDRRVAVRRLREQPEMVRTLAVYREAMHQVEEFGIEILPVTHQTVRQTTAVTAEHGILTTDALHVAVMREAGIEDMATNDVDIQRLTGIRIWVPAS